MAALRKSEDNHIHLHHEDDLDSYKSSLSGHGPQYEAVVDVDRDDDLASLRSKLESSRAPRAVIVIPGNAKILREGLEFRVLRRLQRELGLDIVLVSGDAARRAMARENGFSRVFGSLRSFQGSRLPISTTSHTVPFTDPDEFTPATSIGRLGMLVGAVLFALVAAVVYLALPVATVTVYAEPRALARDIEVVVELGGPPLDVTAQRLSGQLIEQRITVQDSLSISEAPPPNNPEVSGFRPGVQVTVEARDALRNRMLEMATAQAKQQLAATLPREYSMPDASIRTEIVGEKYDRNIGESASELGGSLEVAATGMAFSNDNFNKLVHSLWYQEIPLSHRAAKEPDLTPPAVVRSESRYMTLRTRASGTLQPNVNSDSLIEAVRGHTPEEASSALARMVDLARPPRVTIWPDWASRAFRVEIETAAEPAPPGQTGNSQANR